MSDLCMLQQSSVSCGCAIFNTPEAVGYCVLRHVQTADLNHSDLCLF